MDQPGTDIPDDQTAYLHDWINATYPEQQTVQDIRADECLTVQFYQCCLSALQKTCQQLSAADSLEYSPLSQVKCVLQEELGRLYLCGDGFSSGEAADALERSDDLTENILEILCGIGSLLIRGKYSLRPSIISSVPDRNLLGGVPRVHKFCIGASIVE